MVLVVTGLSLLLLEPHSLALKYRVELADLQGISLSRFSDAIFIVHINPVSTTHLSWMVRRRNYSITPLPLLPVPPPPALQYKATNRSYVKGDFILQTPHVVELVTKTYAAVQETLNRKLRVELQNE